VNKVKIFWIALLLCSGGLGCWFLGKGCFASWDFYQLNTSAFAEKTSWEIIELSSSKYILKATYLFRVKEQEYQGKRLFISHPILNRYAAETTIKEISCRNWRVWFNAKNPSLSSLDKQFPYKDFTYALLCLGVFTYFLYRFQKQMQENFIDSK